MRADTVHAHVVGAGVALIGAGRAGQRRTHARAVLAQVRYAGVVVTARNTVEVVVLAIPARARVARTRVAVVAVDARRIARIMARAAAAYLPRFAAFVVAANVGNAATTVSAP